MSPVGMPPPRPSALPRVSDRRISFLFVERAVVARDDDAVTLTSEEGVSHVPAASVGTMILGPGTSVTHSAITLLASSGTGIVWAGENGVRFYAGGSPLAKSTKLLQAQARLVSSPRSRLDVARAMYGMRFPGEDVSGMTMRQLRGREGLRMRALYQEHAERTGIEWVRRMYSTDDRDVGDPINHALSEANTCLYGVVRAAITAVGCSPGLGFVHTGDARSFVYDIADLYKASITVPAAFDATAQIEEEDLPDLLRSTVRRRVRDRMREEHVLTRCVTDITTLLLGDETGEGEVEDSSPAALWDDEIGTVAGGVDYAEEAVVPW